MKKTISILALFLIGLSGYSQLKTGVSPKVISNNVYFEVESANGSKTVITKDSGNMGIGINTPTHKLHIVSDSNPIRVVGLMGGSTNDSVLVINPSNGVFRRISSISLGAASEPWFNTVTNSGATSNTQNIYQMGRVGIGNSNPQSRLVVGAGTGYEELNIRSGGASNASLKLTATGTKGREYGIFSTGLGDVSGPGNFNIFDFSKNASRVLVDSIGNVGINTTNPSNKLEIKQGTAGNSGLRFTNLINSSTAVSAAAVNQKYLSVDAYGDVVLAAAADAIVSVTGLASGLVSPIPSATFQAGTFENNYSKNDSTVIYVNQTDGTQWVYSATGGGQYKSYSAPASTEWYIANSTNDASSNKTGAIYRTGNIGINTNNPANKLEIKQGSAGNSGLRLTNLPNSSTAISAAAVNQKYLSVDANGDVVLAAAADAVISVTGLTSSLISPVSSSVFQAGTFENNYSKTDSTVIYINQTDGTQWIYTAAGGGQYKSYTAPPSTEWYMANSTTDASSNKTGTIYRMGNVGIGTSDPIVNLEVKGKSTDPTYRDGVILPRLTGDELKAKDNLYLFSSIGTLVYITQGVTSSSPKTINVNSSGYYYFNGALWVKFEENLTNIYNSDGTIGSNRKVTIADLVSFDNQTLNISSKLHSVGVGTSTPDSSAVLDVYSKTQGFLPPRMTKAEMNAIVRPEEGLMVYCYDCKPLGMYNFSPDKWVPIADAIIEEAVFSSGTINCQSGVSSFQTGTYSQGSPMTTSNTKTITVTVVSVGKFTVKTDTVNGITWEQAAPSIFTVGANSQIKLIAKGTPISTGTYTYNVTLSGGLFCTFTITFTGAATFNCSNLTQSDLSPAKLYMENGTSYTQTITVPYTAGNNTTYGATTTTTNGLTLTRVAGTYAASGGNITYNLTGTYTGTTGSNFVTFTTPDGFCPVQVNAYSVSLVANAGTSLQMDNLKVTIPTSGNRSQQIQSVRKAATFTGGSSYNSTGINGASDLSINATTSSWSYLSGGWNFLNAADEQVTYLKDASNNRWYRITSIIGSGYNNNLYHIERMDVNIAGISNGTSVNRGTAVTMDNLKAQIPSTGNVSLQIGAVSGSMATTSVGGYGVYNGGVTTLANFNPVLNTTFTYVKSTDSYGNAGNVQYAYLTDNTNMYKITLVIGSSYIGNLVHIEKLTATTSMSTSGFVAFATDLLFDDLKYRMPSSGKRLLQLSTVSGTAGIDANCHHYWNSGNSMANGLYSITANTTPAYINSTWDLGGLGMAQLTSLRNVVTNKYYKVSLIVSGTSTNNFFYIKRY